MGKKAFLIGLVCTTLSGVVACATHQSYPGPPRPVAETALLVPTRLADRQVFVNTIDGIALGVLHDRARLLPGVHTIEATVVVRAGGRQLISAHTLRLETRANHVYAIKGGLGLYGPRIWITDGNDLVAEAVTAPPRRPAVGSR